MAIFVFNSIVNAQLRRRSARHKRPAVTPATSIGVRMGKDFKHDQLLLGGHLWMPVGIFWKLAPGFEYYFVDKNEDYKRWQFNADFMFKPRPRHPYLGSQIG